MTDREKAIVMAYTGAAMLVGDKFSIYHKYIEGICGRPIYTSEIAFLAEKIKEKSRADFLELCQEETRACDCISRQDLLKKCVYVPIAPVIKGDSVHYEDVVFTRDIINAEPIQPEPKTGHWIPVTNGRGGHECDKCHEYAPSYQNGDEYLSRCCPNCGARMKSEGNNG